MADGIVALQPDSTGKKVDTSEIVVGANTVERQRVVFADPVAAAGLASVINTSPAGTEYGIVTRNIPSGTQPVNITSGGTLIGTRADGFLRTVIDPTTLLFDTFETLDTTNTWTLGGTVPSGANGVLTVNASATASAISYAVSKPAFTPGASAYLQAAMLVTVQAGTVTGANQFWGVGVLTTPTTAVPITNGTIFEIDTTGALLGSTYSNGVRTQTVALTKPVDGNVHRYVVYYKASRAYFEIDNVTVGSLAFPNPAVSALSALIGQANSATVTGTPTLTATLIGVGDTGRNASKIADGTFPWRTASVTAAGELIVSFKDFLPASQNLTAQDLATTSTAGANGQNIVTGTATAGSVASVAISGDSSFAIQISGVWTGTLQFERSLDSGITYTPIGAFSAGTSFITSTVTQNGAFHGNAASATNIRVRSTSAWTGTATVKLLAGAGSSTITIGNPLRLFDKVSGVEHSIKAASTGAAATDTALVVALSPNSPTPTGGNTIGFVKLIDGVNAGTIKAASTASVAADTAIVVALSPNSPLPAAALPATFSASINGLALAALATDVFTLTGSATKTIKITKVTVNAIQTTAAQVAVVLLKRSTANTVGTSTAQTAVPYDSTSVAPTATVLAYTANPTVGALVGNLFTQRVFVPSAATASDAQGLAIAYGDVGQQYPILRGIAQVFAVNLAGVTVTGGSANISIEWTEV